MYSTPRLAIVAFVFCSAHICGAFAEDCHPQGIAATVQLVGGADGYIPVLPVAMNDQPKQMILLTGAKLTEITPSTADALGLPRQKGDFKVFDTSRLSSNDYVNVPFKIGRMSSKGVGMIVLPSDSDVGAGSAIAGVLGPDVLDNYDIDIDFGTGKLNFISQDHCLGRVVYWPATSIAAVPMQRFVYSWIVISVKLDGQPTLAIVDTSAASTTLYRAAAEKLFGLTMPEADAKQTGSDTAQPNAAAAFVHTFKSLEFEGLLVKNPIVQVIPDVFRNTKSRNSDPETGSLLSNSALDEESIKMRIGMDVLRQLHVYIAYKERVLYLTPAGQLDEKAGKSTN